MCIYIRQCEPNYFQCLDELLTPTWNVLSWFILEMVGLIVNPHGQTESVWKSFLEWLWRCSTNSVRSYLSTVSLRWGGRGCTFVSGGGALVWGGGALVDGCGSLLLQAGGSALMTRHDSSCCLPSPLCRLSRSLLLRVSSRPSKAQHDQWLLVQPNYWAISPETQIVEEMRIRNLMTQRS